MRELSLEQYFVGYISGLILAAIGAFVADWLQRRRQRRRDIDAHRVRLYQLLTKLSRAYREMHEADKRCEDMSPLFEERVVPLCEEVYFTAMYINDLPEMEIVLRAGSCTAGVDNFKTKRDQAIAAAEAVLERASPRFASLAERIQIDSFRDILTFIEANRDELKQDSPQREVGSREF